MSTDIVTNDKPNGVDVANFFATINAVKQQPELAAFQFRATTAWINGTHSRSTIEAFSGPGSELRHERPSPSTPTTRPC